MTKKEKENKAYFFNTKKEQLQRPWGRSLIGKLKTQQKKLLWLKLKIDLQGDPAE